MRVARNAAVIVTVLLAGCQASTEPAPPPSAQEPAADPYWEQDDAYLLARGVAAAGAPSSTPELDAIAALAATTTPERTLRELLERVDRPIPPVRLRPGDRVVVDVFGRDELSGDRRVGPDGRIPLSLAGSLAVAGLTESDASAAVTSLVSQLAREPQVQVRLLEPAPSAVRVVGRAANAGSFPLPTERALDCLDLIALAGGLLEDADVARLTLLRSDDGRTCGFHFSYDELLASRPAGWTSPLRPDDVLVVPRLPDVYAFGQVSRSGAFPLRGETTVASLILQAGGLTEGASVRDLQLLRGAGSLEVSGVDQPLRAGDVVFVPQRRRVYLVGEGVANAGPVDLPGTGLTVVQALAAVGWLTKHADLDGVEVMRYRRGEHTRFSIPLRQILSGELRSDYPLQPGDVIHVPETVF